jgi:acetolactate synthase-1/2/3 large subunit
MKTIGEAIVEQLEQRRVDTVFGIPGVHTVELYRGLAVSKIRHITARHEQGVGFMADGYARVSGKPGVAFVITGPGLANMFTPMAQARADSSPMLVISGVNARETLGRGFGCLHELPAQQEMSATVSLVSTQLNEDSDLMPALDQAYNIFSNERCGPVHIEVPTDVMKLPYVVAGEVCTNVQTQKSQVDLTDVTAVLKAAKSPVIIAGGGARWAGSDLQKLAERLDAPVVETVNARGLLHGHALCVPASPSLKSTNNLIKDADVVLALGTEFGPTDYGMYGTVWPPEAVQLIRVDISADQLARHPVDYPVCGRVEDVLPNMVQALGNSAAQNNGAVRAAEVKRAAWDEIGPDYRVLVGMLETIQSELPEAILIGDSTQITYAGNLFYDHDRAGGWFNAATGFGALGFSIPACIGASLADPTAQVVCLVGDGGAQFSMPEIMVAVDEKLPIIFIVLNNHGYQEIETSMAAAGVTVVGCDPTPPDFGHCAKSFGIPFQSCAMSKEGLAGAIQALKPLTGPVMIEVKA